LPGLSPLIGGNLFTFCCESVKIEEGQGDKGGHFVPDRIVLQGMVFYGYHGVFGSEKELGQRYEVDLELALDLSSTGRTDDLEYGINYVDLYQLVREIVEERSYNLMEGLAEAIASEVLSNYPMAEVTVAVRKPQPPAGGLMDFFGVKITRKK
jgi:dihydroneopterin aldolase